MPTYEAITLIPEAPLITSEYEQRCYRSHYTTRYSFFFFFKANTSVFVLRQEIGGVLTAKENDFDGDIEVILFVNGVVRRYEVLITKYLSCILNFTQPGVDSLNITELEKFARYWASFKFPNGTKIEIFHGECSIQKIILAFYLPIRRLHWIRLLLDALPIQQHLYMPSRVTQKFWISP